MPQHIYAFDKDLCEGDAKMKALLGGKGANLAEMAKLGLRVPPGFTITTEVCKYYVEHDNTYPEDLAPAVDAALARLEKLSGKGFGSATDPLLVSVRSGAAISMPGMMDTVLNLGLNDATLPGLVTKSGSERFALDSYRRFIQMYGNVVKGLGGETFEVILEDVKKQQGASTDAELTVESLKALIVRYKEAYAKKVGNPFPQDPKEQLWGAITAVFGSWMNARAIKYREINNITGLFGTAVNVQTMVFGNRGTTSATGVCFSRNPSNGDPRFFGEYLVNAQGEDVVAGIRTPQQITKEGSVEWAASNGISTEERESKFPSLEEVMPTTYKDLYAVRDLLENHFKDMQDIEFTIEDGVLYILQTRNAKRTAAAAVKCAMDMLQEGLLTEDQAILRVDPIQLDNLLHPALDLKNLKEKPVAKGLPASPGAAVGQVVFSAESAEQWAAQGKAVVLLRVETSPEDIGGMHVSKGILTARGGMTSHAAVVARGMGTPCVAGCSAMVMDHHGTVATIGTVVFNEGDWISLDGSTGAIYQGKLPLVDPQLGEAFENLMTIAKKRKRLGVRANADTPTDASNALKFGAEGIGLCRTEHMFFEESRILAVREMILADDTAGREAALVSILPMQREDFVGIFTAMSGKPVIIRLLDPPLHEFVPHDEAGQLSVAKAIGVPIEKVQKRVAALHEMNPMMGHRGCRLGITYPEIYNIQTRAIIEAAIQVEKATGTKCVPEIMIPLVGKVNELSFCKAQCIKTAEATMAQAGAKVDYQVGTMIEVPRACVTADLIAKEAAFFSFGTNDLTQMGCGFSRDDAGTFLTPYVKLGIYDHDPFEALDQSGVGELMRIAVTKARSVKPDLKLGICGEHGGEPSSIKFVHGLGLDYVSCSPFRVPIAILAAAHAAVGGK